MINVSNVLGGKRHRWDAIAAVKRHSAGEIADDQRWSDIPSSFWAYLTLRSQYFIKALDISWSPIVHYIVPP